MRVDLLRTAQLGFASMALFLALVAVFSCLRAVNLLEPVADGAVVIRIDDIQDYAFHDAQIQLLKHSVTRGYPLSLGVIAKDFGLDVELTEAVQAAIRTGSEIGVHGWIHEDLTQLTANEQEIQFLRAKNRLWNTVEVNTRVLIPPTYSYSNDTLLAMRQAGYEIVSGYIDLNEGGIDSEGIVSVPATVELSELSGDNWTMKSVDEVMAAFNVSIGSNGYAVIVTHPEEFLQNGTLNENALERYYQIIDSINSRFELTTLAGLKPRVLLANSMASSSERLGMATLTCLAIRPRAHLPAKPSTISQQALQFCKTELASLRQNFLLELAKRVNQSVKKP